MGSATKPVNSAHLEHRTIGLSRMGTGVPNLAWRLAVRLYGLAITLVGPYPSLNAEPASALGRAAIRARAVLARPSSRR